MIALVALPNFPAAVEQHDNPRLQGQPLGLVAAEHSGTLIALSPEALAAGLLPGSRREDALQQCPGLRYLVAQPARYAERSARIMQALQNVSPELEVFALDEAYLDLTSCQSYYRNRPERIVELIRQTVRQASGGLDCVVGLSGDKTTARWAAHNAGSGIVLPEAAEAALAALPLAALGMGADVVQFFAEHGVQVCGDMKKIPGSLPARRFGNLGRRLWLMAQGRDPSPVDPVAAQRPPARTLPPATRNPAILQTHYLQLAEKAALALRREGRRLQDFQIGLRAPEGWRHAALQTDAPTDDGLAIFQLCKRFLRQSWFGEEVQQVYVQGLLPVPVARQPDFFIADPSSRKPAGHKKRPASPQKALAGG